MKKSEIIQLALIILGVLIILKAFELLFYQLGMIFDNEKFGGSLPYGIIYHIAIILFLGIAGFVLINFSNYFSRRILKHDSNENIPAGIDRKDLLSISVVVMCLFFILSNFSSFFSAFIQLIYTFFNDFVMFREILTQQIWIIVQYAILIILLLKASSFTYWIDNVLLSNAGNGKT